MNQSILSDREIFHLCSSMFGHGGIPMLDPSMTLRANNMMKSISRLRATKIMKPIRKLRAKNHTGVTK